MKPLVSIIVPTKNSSQTLDECLGSIRSQTYSPIEGIVVDHHMTQDATPAICKKHHVRYIAKSGKERSEQRNRGAQEAKGTYILFIDSDMVLSPKVVEECVNMMATSRSIAAVTIPEESFGVGMWAACKKLERSFYVGIDWLSGARFMKKSTFLSIGGYDSNLISAEDWDLQHRLEKEGTIKWINALIYHNEGNPRLTTILKKKYYYATQYTSYEKKNNNPEAKQSTIIKRYMLFFSNPRKLFRNPIIGLCMLTMITLEFSLGIIGYFHGKIVSA